MSKNIRLRSEEVGFKFLLLALSIWTLIEGYSGILRGGKYNAVPCLLLAGALGVQGFYEIFMKRKNGLR